MYYREQLQLKKSLIPTDSKQWDLTSGSPNQLRLVGGVDISFVNDANSNEACASLVVCSYPDLEVVYEDYQKVQLQLPYIPGFLAFREVGFIVDLVEKLRKSKPSLLPQVRSPVL